MDEVRLVLDLDDEDRRRVAELSYGLRRDLLRLPVESIDWDVEQIPEDAKGALGESVGTLVVTGMLSSATLTTLARIVIEWIRRSGARRVTVEVDGDRLILEGAATKDQRAVIQEWVARRLESEHREKPATGGDEPGGG